MLQKNTTNENLKSCVVLQPSNWMKDFLLKSSFNACPIDIWPAGIDTDIFIPSNNPKEIVLIYFKQRFKFELLLVTSILKKKGIPCEIIEYGAYEENDYKQKLNRSRYIIWIGRSESQGIAMGEALSQNIPMLVWEISCFGHAADGSNDMFTDDQKAYVGAHAATYFDDTCGKIIYHAEEIDTGIDFLEKNLVTFRPRDYVLKNLSIKRQAQAFINLYDTHWAGIKDTAEPNMRTRNNSWKPEFLMKTISALYYRLKK